MHRMANHGSVIFQKANKQLENAKGYMDKGFVKLIKMNKDPKVKSLLVDLQTKANKAAVQINYVKLFVKLRM